MGNIFVVVYSIYWIFSYEYQNERIRTKKKKFDTSIDALKQKLLCQEGKTTW